MEFLLVCLWGAFLGGLSGLFLLLLFFMLSKMFNAIFFGNFCGRLTSRKTSSDVVQADPGLVKAFDELESLLELALLGEDPWCNGEGFTDGGGI